MANIALSTVCEVGAVMQFFIKVV